MYAQLSGHGQVRPITVYGTFLVQQVNGGLVSVEDDNRLPKGVDVNDVAWFLIHLC